MKTKSNFRQLQIFQEVVRTGSLTKAARRLNLTQPAVSSAIANLEQEVGFILFKRNHYGTELTVEAQYLAEGVEKVLSSVKSLDELASDLKHGRAGKLYVGCMPGFSSTALPKVIATFMRENPGAKVSLQTFSSTKVEEWVAAGHFDIGIVEMPNSPAELEVRPYSFELLCVVPRDSALAEKSAIGVADLDGQPLITLDENHQTTRQITSLFRKHGCELNVVVETHLFPSAIFLVNEGLGCALIDPVTTMSFVCRSDANLVVRPFTPSVTMDVAIILPKYQRPSRQCGHFSAALEAAMDELVLQGKALA